MFYDHFWNCTQNVILYKIVFYRNSIRKEKTIQRQSWTNPAQQYGIWNIRISNWLFQNDRYYPHVSVYNRRRNIGRHMFIYIVNLYKIVNAPNNNIPSNPNDVEGQCTRGCCHYIAFLSSENQQRLRPISFLNDYSRIIRRFESQFAFRSVKFRFLYTSPNEQ